MFCFVIEPSKITYQVVTQTLWTIPEATREMRRHITISGYFNWNALPNKDASTFPMAVKIRRNRTDPKYPPRIVCTCDSANQVLYICIPENSRTANMEERINEVPLETAENKTILLKKN